MDRFDHFVAHLLMTWSFTKLTFDKLAPFFPSAPLQQADHIQKFLVGSCQGHVWLVRRVVGFSFVVQIHKSSLAVML